MNSLYNLLFNLLFNLYFYRFLKESILIARIEPKTGEVLFYPEKNGVDRIISHKEIST